jgi:hypothetical protein
MQKFCNDDKNFFPSSRPPNRAGQTLLIISTGWNAAKARVLPHFQFLSPQNDRFVVKDRVTTADKGSELDARLDQR